MFAFNICQSFGQIGHRGIKGNKAHRQLGLLGLSLLVLGSLFPASVLSLLLLIHIVYRPYLAHPGIDHGVDRALAAGIIARDV